MNVRTSTSLSLRRALPALGALVLASSAYAQSMMGDPNPPPERKTPVDISAVRRAVSFDQKLGADVPLGLQFRDETGALVELKSFFGKKPVILTPVYYGCPMLCTQVLNGLVTSLRVLGLEPGKDFEIVSFSINPTEEPALAAEKKQKYLRSLGKSDAEAGWHFLTALPLPAGDARLAADGEVCGPGADNIHTLTQTIGFRTWFDRELGHYAHEPGIVVLTPGGRVSKYLFGIEFDARTLKFALIEASDGKVGTLVDQLWMMCFHYDPATGKYGLMLTGAMQVAAALFLLVLGTFLVRQLRRERRAGRPQAGGA